MIKSTTWRIDKVLKHEDLIFGDNCNADLFNFYWNLSEIEKSLINMIRAEYSAYFPVRFVGDYSRNEFAWIIAKLKRYRKDLDIELITEYGGCSEDYILGYHLLVCAK